MKKNKIIWVIIPQRNSSSFTLNALKSVFDINKDLKHLLFKTIVIDDHSNDVECNHDLFDKKNNDVFLENFANGVSSARNTALEKLYDLSSSINNYVLFLDSDDFLTLDFFKYIDENEYLLNENDYISFSYTNSHHISGE
ncbi:glycosyltransferase family 2 protein, partial [Oenococcus oeni]|uniref:glycosyltransferase family 2 protein n=1 Tax=Oenococcus oeni TaxID=1247 RepID=UPI0016441891